MTRIAGGGRGIGRWIGYALLAALLALAVWVLTHVNAIPRLAEEAKAAWAQVENTYQRRADLVPNLVETVKAFARQEREVLTAVVEARSRATQVTLSPEALSDPAALAAFEAGQAALGDAIARLLVVVEAYPELRSSDNFLALQAQLEGTENRIAVARRDYIQAVRAYNVEVLTFPGLIWAIVFGADPFATFSATEGAAEAPRVEFQQQ